MAIPLGRHGTTVGVVLVSAPILLGCGAEERGFESPYDEVDWDRASLHKFDGHVHARRGNTVADMVEAYDAMGYGAIAFGDATLRYPMEDYLQDPDAHDLTVIPGQGNLYYSPGEPYANHTKVWFSEVDYDLRELDYDEALRRVGRDGGLANFAHPSSPMYYPMYSVWVDTEWYVEQFERHDHLVGLEVNNHGMDGSLELFDELLTHFGPDRLIVGFGVSDTQGLSEDGSIGSEEGFGFSLLVSEDSERESLRRAIEDGRVFWVDTREPDATTEALQYPRIESLEVSEERITVEVEGPHDRISWIHRGRAIHEGNVFTLDDRIDSEQNYVRFEIQGPEDTTVGSQAFLIVAR